MENLSLSKKVNYPELGGVMTKKEFIQKAKAEGWTTTASEMNGYQNGDYNRTHFNRLSGEDQTRYEEKMKKVKTVYSIHPPEDRNFYDITKSEFDFFNSLN